MPTMKKPIRKRPCSVCRKWFAPDPRAGDRQRTCSDPPCRAARATRAKDAWRAHNPDAAAASRIQNREDDIRRKLAERARVAAEKADGGKVPRKTAKDKRSVEDRVRFELLARVIPRNAKDRRRSQVVVRLEESDRQIPETPKDEMDGAATPCEPPCDARARPHQRRYASDHVDHVQEVTFVGERGHLEGSWCHVCARHRANASTRRRFALLDLDDEDEIALYAESIGLVSVADDRPCDGRTDFFRCDAGHLFDVSRSVPVGAWCPACGARGTALGVGRIAR